MRIGRVELDVSYIEIELTESDIEALTEGLNIRGYFGKLHVKIKRPAEEYT